MSVPFSVIELLVENMVPESRPSRATFSHYKLSLIETEEPPNGWAVEATVPSTARMRPEAASEARRVCASVVEVNPSLASAPSLTSNCPQSGVTQRQDQLVESSQGRRL